MCHLCTDAVREHWPDLPEEDWYALLMGATCFPLGSGEETARQVKEMAEKSGCNVGMACAIADAETQAGMEEFGDKVDTECSPSGACETGL